MVATPPPAATTDPITAATTSGDAGGIDCAVEAGAGEAGGAVEDAGGELGAEVELLDVGVEVEECGGFFLFNIFECYKYLLVFVRILL